MSEHFGGHGLGDSRPGIICGNCGNRILAPSPGWILGMFSDGGSRPSNYFDLKSIVCPDCHVEVVLRPALRIYLDGRAECYRVPGRGRTEAERLTDLALDVGGGFGGSVRQKRSEDGSGGRGKRNPRVGRPFYHEVVWVDGSRNLVESVISDVSVPVKGKIDVGHFLK